MRPIPVRSIMVSNRPSPRPRLAALLCAWALVGAGCFAPSSSGAGPAQTELADARAATRRGAWREAAGRWSEILQRGDERSEEACIEFARAQLELGDAPGSQRIADMGLRTFPASAGLFLARARALLAQGWRHSAETALEQAVAAAPGRADIVLELARLALELGNAKTALSELEPRLEPRGALERDPAAWALAARAQRMAQRGAEALCSYERAFELAAPTPEALVDAASTYAEEAARGRAATAAPFARRWLGRAVELDPQSTAAHLRLGELELAEGRAAEAAARLRRAVETDPANVDALLAFARALSVRGPTEESIAIARRALELEQDPTRRAELERLATPAPPPGTESATAPATPDEPRDQER